MRRTKKDSGFTLVELLVVVTIIGLLASVAAPAYSKYIKRARTVEGVSVVNDLTRIVVVKTEEDIVDKFGTLLESSLPGTASYETPACCLEPGGICQKLSATYQTNGSWRALGYNGIGGAHRFAVRWRRRGSTEDDGWVEARADQNCDTRYSLFSRQLFYNRAARTVTKMGLYTLRPLD